MTKNLAIQTLTLFALFNGPTYAQAPLPSVDLRSLAAIVVRDFDMVDKIHTIGMTDDPLGRFDVVVVGAEKSGAWRAEVLSVEHHKISVRWNSSVIANEPEYSSSGPKSITVKIGEYNYDLLIEACAPHLCKDGVSGFLALEGKTGTIAQAKVVTQGLDKAYVIHPKYDVLFTGDSSEVLKDLLKREICDGRTISNKSGLPFDCQSK